MAKHELDSVLHQTYDTSFELFDAYYGYIQGGYYSPYFRAELPSSPIHYIMPSLRLLLRVW